jgi:PAS domain S-box-containing protein
MLRGALDRRAAEEVAHHTKERLDLALSAAMMGVWDHDLATGTVTWSEHLARLVARDREMIGTLNAFSDYVHPDDQAYVIAQRDGIRDPDRIYTFEFRVRRGDGTWRPVAATGRMILDERGAPARVLGVIMDISARRALESGLQRSQKLETLGQVAGGVAHDFNNVLCSVIVNAEVLREDIEPGPLREQLDEIFDAAMRGAALARQLLSFSRNAEFHPTAVSLDPMITSMQPLLRRLAGRAIELRLSLATDGVEVWADPSQLEQVVMNLVVNARDAMPSGGTITVATERDPLADPGAVAIVVRDTGGGVPAEILERIFEPFFTTKPPGQGTGLGLAVVRAVARQWHGDVSVESTPGQGATFRVQLPVM